MKDVPDLDLGFRDAENYRRKENRKLFNQIFLRTAELERLCDPNIFFLIGEKGTGKTAYAVYLSNESYRTNISTLRYIRETDYEKFMALKKKKHLTLSDYTNIWKVIIYLLLSEQIDEKERKNIIFSRFTKFQNIKKVIDEYYRKAFSPEIIYAIQFLEESKIAAELISKYFKIGGEEKETLSFSESRFQTNLLFIKKHFEEALRSLKLPRNHILFIDGIDIRPHSVPYEDYLECIKGLANAVWSINNDFFANIKDSPGHLRCVIILRPDIFDSLGLQNRNSKVRDNSVILNWITTYPEYRNSNMFLMADRLLSYQQSENLMVGQAWDYYFPYDSKNVAAPLESPTSFITFLRYSLYRPRDILTILSIQKEYFIEQRRRKTDVFSLKDFGSPSFTRKYSDYVLGEVKDQISFYYLDSDYELFLKFFQFLKGRSRFSYDEYSRAYDRFIEFINKSSMQKPGFCDSSDGFLQFLYDLNILCYVSDTSEGPFFGWCYRERSPSNISPKVRTDARYEVHYGLMKALDLGRILR